MSNELTSLNHDQLLQADLKAGKVTPEEVERIWELTRDLSAQAPINVRRAMISIRAAETPEEKVNLSMQFMMAAATELQAAMMRDESKFSHLVAGTETIVKTLQNINPLERRLDRIEDMVGGLGDMLSQLIKANVVPALMEHLKETDTCPNCGDLLPRTAKNGPCSCGNFQPMADAKVSNAEELIPDEEHEADEARRKSIGSAWASPPDQGPLYRWVCPVDDCSYEYLSGIRNPTPHFHCEYHLRRLLEFHGEAKLTSKHT